MKTAECPTDQSLRRYAIGDIDDTLSEEIEWHLADCPACEDSVAQFDSTEDTLIRHLPLAAAPEPEVSPDPPGWLASLRNGPPAEGIADIGAAELDEASGPFADSSAYELLGVLGRGGMGVVYRARHRQLNRQVALKVLRPRLMAAPEARRRFEREIQILGRLHHPGIVMATDASRIGGAAYLVMELIDGIDLGRMVRQGGPLTVAEACEAARQMAEALSAAHQEGTVHRDVKPSNVMVDRQGRVKLLDFGLAHLAVLSTDSLETSLGRLLGTLDYMAPEQSQEDGPLDARADLFGIGATLFYLLTGRPPHGAHAGRSLLDQLRALATAEAPRVSSLRADIPHELDDFIARLLNRDPNERPDSAKTVAEELATWAGCDLATRVEEVHTRDGEEDDSSNNSEAAKRSLSELLGGDKFGTSPNSDVTPAEVPVSEEKRRWTGRTWTTMTITMAVFGAVLYGLTLLLPTPEGTLRIESEVDDVQIQLMNERDWTRELQIDRGNNTSTLRAGRYRVRFAGRHDGIAIDRNMITLLRGKETVARIIRVPKGRAGTESKPGIVKPGIVKPTVVKPAVVKPAVVKPAVVKPAERLYQGTSETEWRRIFKAETEPVAKLGAARALLALAEQLSSQSHLEQVLDIGEEIVRTSFGDDNMDFAFEDGSKPPIRTRRWTLNTSGKEHNAFLYFQYELNDQIRKLAARTLAEQLSAAVLQPDNPRTAFATSLLRHTATSRINRDPEAARIVLSRLDVPLTESDRSAICLLLRSYYLNHASIEQRQKIFSLLNELAVKLREAPAEGLNRSLKDELLRVAQFPGADLPASFRTTLASVILSDLVRQRPRAINHFNFSMGVPGSLPPYDKKYVGRLREQMRYFLSGWILVANEYLEKHGDIPNDRAVRQVVRSLEMVLLLYCDGDDWPVDKTASLLTEQLRTYYTDDGKETSAKLILTAKTPSTKPATLLTQIVRVTGKIPDFVRDGHPSARSDVRLLNRYKVLLTGNLDPKRMGRGFDALTGLLDVTPYQVIKLSVGEKTLSPKTRIIVRGLWATATPGDLLYVVSSLKDDPNNRRSPPIDPLLILAVLADLTGKSEAQDERIATLLAHTAAKLMLRGHVEKLLSSPLRAREHARRMLQQMAANAKSQDLIDAINYLDPTLAKSKTSK